MVKKNGFTLIELIATIVLIALLSTTILINMTGIKSNQDEASSSRFKSMIEEAACSYIDRIDNMTKRENFKNTGGYVTLKELICEGLFDEETKDIETNTNALLQRDNIRVHIYWTPASGIREKKCVFERTGTAVNNSTLNCG